MKRVDYAKTNSLNLMENLAEVQYILSDKTGTLTQNELTFVAVCSQPDSSHIMGQTTTRPASIVANGVLEAERATDAAASQSEKIV